MMHSEEGPALPRERSARVLVTSGRLWSDLAMVRALGKSGFQVEVVDSSPRAIARYSRFCKRFHLAPSLTEEPAAYLRFVLELVQREKFAFVVPTFEEAIVLSVARDELKRYTHILLNEPDTYLRVHSKARLYDFCRHNGIPTPPTVVLESVADGEAALRKGLRFPLYYKDPLSRGAMGTKRIESPQQLREVLAQVDVSVFADPSTCPLLQQPVEGYQIATQAVFKDGRMLSLHMYRNIVEYPPGSGSGVVRESVYNEQIAALMQRMGALLKYQGLMGVDFLIEENTGRPYLIDVNPRLPLGFCNAFASGARLHLAYAAASNGDGVEMPGYRLGVRTRFFVFHLYWLGASLKKPKTGIGAVLRQWRRDKSDTYPEFFDPDDLGPAMALPYIFARLQMKRNGKSDVERFLYGGVFARETYEAMVAAGLMSRPVEATQEPVVVGAEL